MSTESQTENKVSVSNTIEENTTSSASGILSTFENPEDFIEKNQKKLIIIGSVIAIAIAGFFGFKYFQKTQEAEAQAELFQSVYYFEADSLDLALNGNGNKLGLLAISEDYGMTKAANLANFYAGVSYLKKGKFDEAITYLEKFSSSDLILQARAYSLIGDAYSEKNDLPNAVDFYTKAAGYKPNKQFTPTYLMKLGLAQELSKDYSGAVASFDKIITDYPTSEQATEAKKYKGLNESRQK